MLTDQQQKFLELSKKAEDTKNFLYKELYPQLDELMIELGLGTHFQDPATSAVYEIVVPKGTYTFYKTIGYNRTKFDGESKGTLSKSAAEGFGYSLKKAGV